VHRAGSGRAVTTAVAIVFAAVYIGMMAGALPFTQLDRTGVALLGAIAIVGLGALTPEQAALSVHLPTILLLFAFMVISAQLRLGGFYTWVTQRTAQLPLSPPALLAVLITLMGALSAIFSNDIVCLAAAPVLARICVRRGLDPLPFLLALACAANVGSAATLIGNPQNMLIGASLELDFAGYAALALPIVVPCLIATWALIAWRSRGRWALRHAGTPVTQGSRLDDAMPFDAWQTAKGLAVAAILLALFLWSSIPREVAALTGAGVLLMSRRLHSTRMLGLVDWELLVLFIGLFVVNRAFQDTGLVAQAVAELASLGIALERPAALFGASFLLSNLVSNVPAVMLLLPVASHPSAGPILALASTLAGNLLLVGSIANIIVADAAAKQGVRIDWRTHAGIGIPVTIVTLAIAALGLVLQAPTA
jgi:Na+/H+ antiporter NhaD/arsenite permease-like protein